MQVRQLRQEQVTFHPIPAFVLQMMHQQQHRILECMEEQGQQGSSHQLPHQLGNQAPHHRRQQGPLTGAAYPWAGMPHPPVTPQMQQAWNAAQEPPSHNVSLPAEHAPAHYSPLLLITPHYCSLLLIGIMVNLPLLSPFEHKNACREKTLGAQATLCRSTTTQSWCCSEYTC